MSFCLIFLNVSLPTNIHLLPVTRWFHKYSTLVYIIMNIHNVSKLFHIDTHIDQTIQTLCIHVHCIRLAHLHIYVFVHQQSRAVLRTKRRG